jgi:predicted MFS family arabinose efflux permease
MTTTNPSADTAAAGVLTTLRESPRPVKVLIAGMLVNRLGSFLHAFLVLYLIDRGYSATYAAVALGALGVGGVAGGLVGGWVTDKLGSRRTIVVSGLGTALATASILYAPGFLGAVGCALLVGALGQAYRPASSALLAAYTPQARYTMVFAMYRLATNLGGTGGPLIGVALIAVSYTALFLVEAAVLVLYALVALAWLPPDPPAPEPAVSSTQDDQAPAPARSVLADRRYLLFLLAVLLVSTVYVEYLAGLPLLVHDRGLSTTVYGVLVAVNGLIVAALELPATRYTQRWAPRTAFMANIALIGAGMTMYAFAPGVAGLVLATVVWSVGEIVGAPTMFSYPARIAPPALRGRYLGAGNAAISIAFAAGPVLGAQLWTVAGDGLWIACGAVSVVAVAAAYGGMRSHDQPNHSHGGVVAEPRTAGDPA